MIIFCYFTFKNVRDSLNNPLDLNSFLFKQVNPNFRTLKYIETLYLYENNGWS